MAFVTTPDRLMNFSDLGGTQGQDSSEIREEKERRTKIAQEMVSADPERIIKSKVQFIYIVNWVLFILFWLLGGKR